MTIDVNEYKEIDQNPMREPKEKIPPEKEFFHSVYVAGVPRTHDGITEQSGKIQIRGFDYNLDSVNMIITHIKPIFAKETSNASTGQTTTECFCFQSEEPWKGTTGRFCGKNRAERSADKFCDSCKSQIILAGVYCNESGVPKLQDKEDGKSPVFIFIRGKGTKYMSVSEYVQKLARLEPSDIGPLTDITIPENLSFEKRAINHKRFVTKVTKGTVTGTKGNIISVFNFEQGAKLPDKVAIDILKLSKKIIEKFNEKFDWSKNKNTNKPPGGFIPAEGETFDKPIQGGSTQEESFQEDLSSSVDNFSFDDVNFDT